MNLPTITPSDNPTLDLKIPHRNWRAALNELYISLLSASPGEVVCMTGPSRSGKTKLSKEVQSFLSGDRGSPTFNQYLCISVIASNTGKDGRFSTKAFAARLLEAVDHPSLELLDDFARASRLDRLTENAIITMLVRSLQRRGVRYLFIDEAQHVQYSAKGSQAPSAVMDSWKCLAEAAGIVLVIVGAYPVLSVIKQSPHLSGRTRIVHCKPYTANKADMEELLSITQTFLVRSGHKLQVSLADYVSVVLENTLGCIGLLRLWLIDALNYAALKSVPFSRQVLDETRKPYSFIEGIVGEMAEGQRNLLLTQEDYDSSFKITPDKTISRVLGTKPFQKKPRRVDRGNRL